MLTILCVGNKIQVEHGVLANTLLLSFSYTQIYFCVYLFAKVESIKNGKKEGIHMQTSAQVKRELTTNIINRMGNNLTRDQIQELKTALDIELYRLNVSQESSELIQYDDTYVAKLNSFIVAKRIEGRAESTLKRYREIIIMMLNSLNKPVDEITTEDIRYYLAWYKQKRNVQEITLDGMRLCICSFFKWLHQEQYITYDPTSRVNKIKFKKKVKEVITDENLELLKAQCKNTRDYALIEFLMSTGIRIGELVKLNIDDIDFHTYKILINGKGNKQRIVKMNGASATRLKLYLNSRTDDNPALFTINRKPYKRLDISGARAVLKKLAKEAGVTQNIFPHALRTKFATDMSKHGAPIEHVASLLGHENINTTRIYSLTSQDDLEYSYNKYMY